MNQGKKLGGRGEIEFSTHLPKKKSLMKGENCTIYAYYNVDIIIFFKGTGPDYVI